ncbi:hypothetical protein MPF_1301 [Methanohalophilus portucalensis FDF-1]|uniref:Uncharacterized protein n=1 Tax=Methanohalophilus portucalensis FDF-1 TaxID=523843 RepID=A0A1L9C4H4_9EURY|nr:hypothetical protein MPF_1301 [Methanohalophilus portucalensis FDF-1]
MPKNPIKNIDKQPNYNNLWPLIIAVFYEILLLYL